MRVLMTIAVCAVALCGCTTSGRSYMSEIRTEVWSEPVEVTLPNGDTLSMYDLVIALRHDNSLNGSRVDMTVRTVTPDSLWVEEQLSMGVGDDGRSSSLSHETSCIYRRNVRLAREGNYRIIVTPQHPVRGVTAVGVDMSKSLKE